MDIMAPSSSVHLWSLRGALPLLLLFVLSGCAMHITWPEKDGDILCAPVSVIASWEGTVTANSFVAKLDNVDVTSQFAVQLPNQHASALLATTTGLHTLVLGGEFAGLFGNSNGTATRTFTVPGLSIAAEPSTSHLARNESMEVTVLASACRGTGTVTVSLPAPPAEVTPSPSSFVVNFPALPPGFTVVGTTTESGTLGLTASATAPPTHSTVAVSGNAAEQSASTTFVIDVATPHIDSLDPSVQSRGGTVTIHGTDLDPNCLLNSVELDQINNWAVKVPVPVSPRRCPTTTELLFDVPSDLPLYGSTDVTVTDAGFRTNTLKLTVAREGGSFVEITPDILGMISSGRFCANGAVRLDVTGTNVTGTNVARYVTTGPSATTVGNISFTRDTNSIVPYFNATPTSLTDLGGAGFSSGLCNLGLVLDAGKDPYRSNALPALNLVDFNTVIRDGAYYFPFVSAVNVTSEGVHTYIKAAPRIFRSPDGTIILVVHPSTSGYKMAVGVIDAFKLTQWAQADDAITTIDTDTTDSAASVSAELTANNEIVLTVGGTTFTVPIR